MGQNLRHRHTACALLITVNDVEQRTKNRTASMSCFSSAPPTNDEAVFNGFCPRSLSRAMKMFEATLEPSPC